MTAIEMFRTVYPYTDFQLAVLAMMEKNNVAAS